MHKKEVSENISLKSCSMITEIRAVEAMNKKQEKKRFIIALAEAIEKYHKSPIGSEWF
jgi:hypothetical protein